MTGARLLMLALLAMGPCGVARAHTGQRAFILLLPTDLYIVGGASVVALSFVAMALIPIAGLRALERALWRLGGLPGIDGIGPGLGALAVVLGLVIAGYAGGRDPLSNPLPQVIWNLQVAGIVGAHVLGDSIAHFLALRDAADPRRAVPSQLPMTALLIGDTLVRPRAPGHPGGRIAVPEMGSRCRGPAWPVRACSP